jgi:TRAP-type C4-dicarboxylate transport system substrate-binding protein
MVSDRFLQKLPPDVQQGLLAAAAESMPEQRLVFRQGDIAALDRLKARGVIAETADPKPFSDASKPVWDKFANDVGGREAIEAVLATK